ncbi:MAG TPA: N-acetylmuramic acid 6-phosphate etherase [Abditibacterium sp.]|jgi:N-acetylmuramic acid 6-phosphate etherase
MDLGHLISEQINEKTRDLSRVSTLEALQLINDEDQKVALAVREVLPQIALTIDQIAPKLENGGRLFYIGAGTSGRLGVVDASECPPTFGVPHEMVQGIIAGGREAVFKSQEGAEDIYENGARDLKSAGFSKNDCLVGLAASGRTPYILGALDYAREIGSFTAGISVNPHAEMEKHCEIFIGPVVGPEALAGSSRMKAGTAQKMVLNMISTGVMLRLGRVEGNLMTHLTPSCEKLVERQARIAAELEARQKQA